MFWHGSLWVYPVNSLSLLNFWVYIFCHIREVFSHYFPNSSSATSFSSSSGYIDVNVRPFLLGSHVFIPFPVHFLSSHVLSPSLLISAQILPLTPPTELSFRLLHFTVSDFPTWSFFVSSVFSDFLFLCWVVIFFHLSLLCSAEIRWWWLLENLRQFQRLCPVAVSWHSGRAIPGSC